ncbi:MAG: hypothetical protein KF824_12790 [Fimbriimonadaceae bacterium]|nr:MAG: hypothetical protein KF824_12790 [Fimbriimonadaceae bacterium]
MPLSNDVVLSLKAVPIFPDKCVVCKQTPDTYWSILSNRTNLLFTFLLPVLFLFGFKKTKVPICKSCKKVFVVNRTLRFIITLAFPIILVAIFWNALDDMTRLQRRLVILIGGVMSVIPAIVWQVFNPPAVDVSFYDDNKEYEFKNLEYAVEFAELNYQEVVKVSFEQEAPSEA